MILLLAVELVKLTDSQFNKSFPWSCFSRASWIAKRLRCTWIFAFVSPIYVPPDIPYKGYRKSSLSSAILNVIAAGRELEVPMPVQAPEPPPGTSFTQVRCPKGHRQWVITANDDPREVTHLICPECGIRYTLVIPCILTKRGGAGKLPQPQTRARPGLWRRS
jgi:hypothetical protein